MKRLPGEARRLLDSARDAAEPSSVQRARADASVRARLAQHGIDDLPPLRIGAVHAGHGVATAGAAFKLGAGVLVLAAAFVALQRWRPDDAPAPATPVAPALAAAAALPAAVAPAPVPMAAPEPKPLPESKAAPHLRAAPAMAPDQALRAELRLITEANELLRDERFDEVLQVLARHGRRFPHGVLRAEREGMHVLALCGIGPTERAQRARSQYLRTASHSPLAGRVRAACGAATDER